MEDEIKEKLKESISTAFTKWSNQYYRKRIDKKGRISKKIHEEMKYEDLFLSKRVFILGFNRYVTKQAISNPILSKQKSVLLRAILHSIIYEKGITVKELEKDSKSDELYTRRHTQRLIHEILSDAFIDIDNKHKDERLRTYSTVFSPHTDPQEPYEVPKEILIGFGNIPLTPRNIKWMEINNRVRSVTPEYLTELIGFRDEVLSIMREIGYNTETGRVLFHEIKQVSEIQQIFHNHLQSIMAVMWWRGRRENTQKKLIQDGFPWEYTEKDAAQARDLLFRLTESNEHVFNVLCDSGVAMIETNIHESAEIVFKEAVNIGVGQPVLLGIIHENLGVYHRQNGKPKLMIQEMKQAVDWFRQSGDLYRLAVGLKNLAEAEWMYGLKDTAMKYYRESEEIAEKLDGADKANVYGNLAVSAMRIGDKKMEIDFLSKYIMTCPEDWTERILNADKRLGELTR